MQSETILFMTTAASTLLNPFAGCSYQGVDEGKACQQSHREVHTTGSRTDCCC